MFVTNILNEFVNRSTCIYPISCLRLFMLRFISSISCFMVHLGKGQNATELLTSKGALHPEKLGPVHLVTDMDVSIGNRTL